MSRLKQNSNPAITDELLEWRGRAACLEGKQIHDVVDGFSRTLLRSRLLVGESRRC